MDNAEMGKVIVTFSRRPCKPAYEPGERQQKHRSSSGINPPQPSVEGDCQHRHEIFRRQQQVSDPVVNGSHAGRHEMGNSTGGAAEQGEAGDKSDENAKVTFRFLHVRARQRKVVPIMAIKAPAPRRASWPAGQRWTKPMAMPKPWRQPVAITKPML